MIFDHINNSETYKGLDPKIISGLNYLKEIKVQDKEVKRIELKDGVFALFQVYQGKDKDKAKFESHQKYIDIQYIVSGSEIIEFSNINNIEILEKYNIEKDLILYKGSENLSSIILKSGYFAIFYPQDGHRVGIRFDNEEIFKVVLKIPV